MKKISAKHVLFVVKIALAAVLLLWVLSKAHWGDYVLAKDGSTWTCLPRAEGAKQYVSESYLQALLRGRLERKTRSFAPDQYVPVGPQAPQEDAFAQYVRPGLAGSLKAMNLTLFSLAAACFPLSLLVVGYRFWYILRVQNIQIGLWEITRLTFLGQFFNMVVPGTVGGDLVKAWYVSRHTHKTAAVIMAIFVDRLVGLLELVLMAGVMLAIVLSFGIESFEHMRMSLVTTLAVAAVTAGLMLPFFFPSLRRLPGLQWIFRRLSVMHHIKAAGRSIRIFRRRPRYVFWALVITLVGQSLFLGGIAMIGLALGLRVPVYLYFVYLPLIYILGAIPITPGGVGWVENLYVEFFNSGAAALSAIVALAMLARLLPVLWGLPGLVVAITGPKLPKADQMQAQLDQAEAEEQEMGD
ncbi:MAG: flippase-like domain-containing protein [Phycisphaerae bacterium]|nr:flippase-like domain-containing protein [Phycisphaerae bacterium]